MTRPLSCLLLASLLALLACAEATHEVEHSASADFERGPHRGRWFEDGAFGLELTIFESGVPPEFRAFVYEEGEPRDPAGVALEVTLRRLGGRVDAVRFSPRGEYLLGDREVSEPHSFDVEIVAREGGREHRFAYSSYENRVTLSPEQVETAGIETALAGPLEIREHVGLAGRIVPNEDALTRVMPRFPGVVRSVHKRLGDSVASGDLLVVIESNESLHPYELLARQAGTVIEKNAVPGEQAEAGRVLFTIADLGTVWVDLDVYRPDLDRLRAGQAVRILRDEGAAPVETTLAYLSPIGSVASQTLLARAVLSNAELAWRPGLFVTAEVETAVFEAPVAVAVDALQRVRDWDVVFLEDGGVFEAQPVELGRSDGRHVEIVGGLAAGQRYAVSGSFVLKAEAGKSGASHDH